MSARVALALVTVTFAALFTARAAGEVAGAALQQMVNAERAFARTAAERGVRDAFITWLAPNSIAVQPYGNARAQWEARPAPPPDAKLAKLEWAPRTGDVAASGDLGWLTGDFTMTPPTGEPRHGCYFSIWEQQANGDWRVRLDVGVDTPGPVPFAAPGFVRIGESAGRRVDHGGAPAGSETLVAADRALAADAAARGAAAALVERLAPEARLHRNGRFPLTSAQAIAAAFRSAPPPDVQFEAAVDTHVATSGDLGWTLGRYAPKSGAGESGYYVRVWKRDAAGRWTIAADITQPAR